MVDQSSVPNTIQLRRLKEAVGKILDHLILDVGAETVTIEVDEDFYWDFDEKDLYDVKNKQPALLVGSLIDDWDFLQNIIDDDDREGAVGYMLVHVGPLLKYVGWKVGR